MSEGCCINNSRPPGNAVCVYHVAPTGPEKVPLHRVGALGTLQSCMMYNFPFEGMHAWGLSKPITAGLEILEARWDLGI